jgi:hypothetical protein
VNRRKSLTKLSRPTNLTVDQFPNPVISRPVKLITSAIKIGINENKNSSNKAGNTKVYGIKRFRIDLPILIIPFHLAKRPIVSNGTMSLLFVN